MRQVDGSYFKGGQVEWSPSENIPPVEQSFTHKLGKVPVGMFLVRQRRALNWYVTPAQVARWTRDTVYFSVAQHALHESGTGTLVGASVTITLNTSVEESNSMFLLTSQEKSLFDHPPIKVDSVNADPDDSQRFISFVVKTALEVAPAGNLVFSWAAYGAVRGDDSYVWQVI